MSRRVLLAAGGAVLLSSTAAAMTAEYDARAHSAGTQLRPAADGAAGRTSARASPRSSTRAGAPSQPGEARPTTSRPARHPELTRHAARPPRHEQPRLPSGEPMYTVEDGPKVVALTIDDGPSPVYTPQILRILRRYGITASFSMIGQSAAAFPGVAREVAAAGHMIVNHTWNHYNLGYMSAVAVQDEISQATDAIHAATGERPRMFRAPYGVWPPAVFSCCAQAGLTPLAWSVDPRDWSRPGARAIVRDILADTRTGSIILEHDGGGNRSETVTALKIWLPRLLDKGYLFTTPLASLCGHRPVGPAVAATPDGNHPESPRQVRHLSLPLPGMRDRPGREQQDRRGLPRRTRRSPGVAKTSTTARSAKRSSGPAAAAGPAAGSRAVRRPPPWSGLTSACRHIGDENGHEEADQGDDHGNSKDLAKARALMLQGVMWRLSQPWRNVRHDQPPDARCPVLF